MKHRQKQKLHQLFKTPAFWLLIALAILTLGIILILSFKKNQAEQLACANMQAIDPQDLNPFKTAVPVPIAQALEGVKGQKLSYTLNPQKPTSTFQLKTKNGDTAGLMVSLIHPQTEAKSDTAKDSLRFTSLFPDTQVTLEPFQNQLKETITLKSKKAPITFEYQLEYDPSQLKIDGSQGGYLMVSDIKTGEELAIFPAPQGIDAKNRRIDYRYELSGKTLRLIPSRAWQFDCAAYPITIDPPVASVDWNEALVMVGTNSSEKTSAQDGDIIDLKPAGWHWGTEERQRFAIVKVPALTPQQREEILAKTITQPMAEDGPMPLSAFDRNRVADTPGLTRYGLDYTLIAGPDDLKKIRNPNTDSPVLDARSVTDIIQKKPKPQSSVIPPERNLASRPTPPPPSTLEKLAQTIAPPAKAAGTIVRTIGSAGGRSYSTISAWETACGGATSCDLVTNTEIAQGEIYNDSTFTESVTIDSFTTGSTNYYPVLTVAQTERHNGTAGTGAKLEPTTPNHALQVDDDYTRIEWLEITNWSVETAGSYDGVLVSGDNVLIQYLMVYKDGHGSQTNSDADGISLRTDGRTLTVKNSIVYDIARSGIGIYADSSTLNLYNSTAYYCGVADTSSSYGCIQVKDNVGSSTLNAINVNAMGTTRGGFDDFWRDTSSSWGSSNYNLSQDTSAPGANSLTSKTASRQFTNLTAGSEDFHLIPSADAINAGTTISSEITDDIDLDNRPLNSNYDIGADEYIQKTSQSLEYYISRYEGSYAYTNTSGIGAWYDFTGTPEAGTTPSANNWIDGSNFKVGDRYLIMAWGYYGNNNTNARQGMRVTHGGTSFTESEGIESAHPANNFTPYHWFTVWTAANEDLEVQMFHGGLGQARINEVTLVAINIEEFIRNGDFYYNLNTTGGTLTTTPTSKASINWNAPLTSEVWWVNAYTKMDAVDATGTVAYNARLNLDNGTYRAPQTIAGNHADDSPLYGLGWASTFSTGNHTASVEISEGGADQEWDAAGVFAFRLNAFYEFDYTTTAGATAINAGLNNWVEVATLTHTPNKTANWLTVGGFIADDKHTEMTGRLQSAESDIVYEEGGYRSLNTTSFTPYTAAHIASYPANSALDIDMDARPTIGTSTPEAEDTWLVGISLTRPEESMATWSFDEGTGTQAGDSSRFLNHLTVSGATWKQTDDNQNYARSRYLEFDGTDDYISRASDSDFNFGTGSFTLSGWFKHGNTVSGTDTLIAHRDGPGYTVYMNSSGQICFDIDDDGAWTPDDSLCTATSYADSRWHLFSAVRDEATSLSLYVDGIRVAHDTSVTSTDALDNAATFYIGIDSDGTSNPWQGSLDQFTVYNFARSQNQINVDYTSAAAYFGANPQSPLTNGLVGYWKMEESSWTNDCSTATAIDSSGNNLTGQACPATTGPTGGAKGKFGKSGDFDGSDDYLRIADNSILEPSTEITVAAWVRFDTLPGANDAKIVYKEHSVSPWVGYELAYDETTQKFFFSITDSGGTYHTAYAPITPSTSTWYHLVGIRKADEIRLFVNGQGSAPYPASGTIYNSDGYLNIGRAGGNPVDGKIDEVRVYNRALTPDEAYQLYRWAPGPIAHWNMDEGIGTGADALKDRSGGGIHGDLEASMTAANWQPGRVGGSLSFDGTNDYVDFGDAYDFNYTDARTIEAWIYRRSSGTTQEIIDKRQSASPFAGWGLGFTSTDYLRFEYIVDSSTNILDYRSSAAGVVSTNAWNHVAITYDNKTIQMFVNGIPIASAASTDTLSSSINNAVNTTLGSRNGGTANFFNGLIDEVKIYDYVRTPDEIVEDMNAGHPIGGSPIGSQIGYWKFDENFGDTANDSSPQNIAGNLAGAGACPGNTNCPTWSSNGKYGSALDFDGVNDYVDMGDVSAYDLSDTADFSASGWFYTDVTGDLDTLLGKRRTFGMVDPGYAVYIHDTEQVLTFEISDGTDEYSFKSSTVFNVAGWYHFVVVWDQDNPGNSKFYINGKPENGTHSGTITAIGDASNAVSFRLGTTANGANLFDGKLDEIKLYSVALSADQAIREYSGGNSTIWGSLSTSSTGTPDNSLAREFCVPGDSITCNAPIAHWSLNENTGTTMNDRSGNNLTGTLIGSPVWSVGKLGSGITFSASSQYISVADNALLRPGNGSWTVSLWANLPDTNQKGTILGKSQNGGNYEEYNIYVADDINGTGSGQKIGLSYRQDDTNERRVITSVDVADGKWHHYSFVADKTADVIKIYRDGLPLTHTGENDGAWPTIDNTDSLTIGRHYAGATTHPYSGSVDQVLIYNYARSPAQVAWDFNRGRPIARYKMDENAGTSVYDASGNGNNGTLTTATYVSGKYDYGLNFTGTDYVSLPDNMLDNHSTGSVCTWVKPTTSLADGTTQCLLGFGDTSNLFQKACIRIQAYANPTFGYFVRLNDTANAGSLTSGQVLTKNTWQHICVVQDGTKGKLYLNGTPQTGTFSLTGTATEGDWFGHIGSIAENVDIARLEDNAAGDYFEGSLDELQIFTYPLSPVQVRDIYNQGSLRYGD